jgi:hypothetical protein
MERMSALSYSNRTDNPTLWLSYARCIAMMAALRCAVEARAAGSSLLIGKSQSQTEILVNVTTGSFAARLQGLDEAITVTQGGGKIKSVHFRTSFAEISR